MRESEVIQKFRTWHQFVLEKEPDWILVRAFRCWLRGANVAHGDLFGEFLKLLHITKDQVTREHLVNRYGASL